MSVLHRTRAVPDDPAPTASPSPADEPSTPLPDRVPHTRTSTIWLGICGTALSFVVLIVFMLQNTGSVEVNFLWMNGSLPLALALLIAGVGVAILAITVGAARMTQLRRLVRHRHD
jgi:uncharacterized integral membrane protein